MRHAILTMTCFFGMLSGPALGEGRDVFTFPAIGDRREQIEATLGAPVARKVLAYRDNTELTKHAKRFPEHILAVQVAYLDGRVAHLTLHRISQNEENNLPWSEEDLKRLRAATRPLAEWRKIQTLGERHVHFGGIHIYAPNEVWVVEFPETESWVVMHHISQTHFVQIKHSRFYSTPIP